MNLVATHLKLLAIAVMVVAGLSFADTARAQSATGTDTAAAADISAGGGSVLTPEQIEQLSSMVDQMRDSMQEMIDAARDTATTMTDGNRVIMITTNEIAAIAVGTIGGALVVDLLGGGGIATLAGAVAGGVGAHWLITADANGQIPQP